MPQLISIQNVIHMQQQWYGPSFRPPSWCVIDQQNGPCKCANKMNESNNIQECGCVANRILGNKQTT